METALLYHAMDNEAVLRAMIESGSVYHLACCSNLTSKERRNDERVAEPSCCNCDRVRQRYSQASKARVGIRSVLFASAPQVLSIGNVGS